LSTVLAIDPGLRGCGLAVYVSGRLVEARYVKSSEKSARGAEAWCAMAQAVGDVAPPQVDTLVVECPQVYRGPLQKGDPSDLIELAGVDGAIVGKFILRAQDFVSYLPRDWKGQVPKDIHHARVEAALSKEEKACMSLPAASLAHNVWDAVALGLFHVKKVKERR
jgi:hypothetical protein